MRCLMMCFRFHPACTFAFICVMMSYNLSHAQTINSAVNADQSVVKIGDPALGNSIDPKGAWQVNVAGGAMANLEEIEVKLMKKNNAGVFVEVAGSKQIAKADADGKWIVKNPYNNLDSNNTYKLEVEMRWKQVVPAPIPARPNPQKSTASKEIIFPGMQSESSFNRVIDGDLSRLIP